MEAKRAEERKREFESDCCKREREREREGGGGGNKGVYRRKSLVKCHVYMFGFYVYHACQTVCLSASCHCYYNSNHVVIRLRFHLLSRMWYDWSFRCEVLKLRLPMHAIYLKYKKEEWLCLFSWISRSRS